MALWSKESGGEKPKYLTDEEKSRCYCDDRGWVLVHLNGTEEVLVAANSLNDPAEKGLGFDPVTGDSLDPDRDFAHISKDISLDDLDFDGIPAYRDSDDNFIYNNGFINADGTDGAPDPLGRDGWYYQSAGSPEKINWYYFDGLNSRLVTVDQLQTLHATVIVDSLGSDTFHLVYYTKPLGDGLDAAGWYRSRTVYVPIEPFDRGTKYLFWAGQEPDPNLHPELPRVEMKISTASPPVGPQDPAEELLTIALGTNSLAATGDIEIVVSNLGIRSDVFNAEYDLKIV